MARASLKVSIPGLDIEALSEDGSAEDITKKTKYRTINDIKEAGRRSGYNNRPDEHSKDLDETEKELVTAFQNEIRRYEQKANDVLDAALKVIDALIARISKPSLEEDIQNLQKEIISLQIREEESLRSKFRVYDQACRDLNYFQEKNNLYRPARYATAPEKIWALALILGVVLIETAVNAYFFGRANRFGLIGGAQQAFIISLLNVSVCFVAGYFAFKNIHSRHHFKKVLSMVGIAFAILFAFLFNLIVAHFRDLLDPANFDRDSFDPTRLEVPVMQLMDRVQTQTFEFNSFDSLMLLFAGWAAAVFAIGKGYLLGDPFPGYGRLASRRDAAREDYSQARAQFKQKWVNRHFKDYQKVQQAFEKYREGVIQLKNYIVDYNNIIEFVQSRMAERIDQFNYWIKVYREANKAVRTAPSPARFHDTLQLETRKWQGLPSDRNEALRQYEESAAHLQKEVEKARHDLHSAAVRGSVDVEKYIENYEGTVETELREAS